jgi:NMD protein affecting ribosome stability and mRNA decay
MKRVHNNWVCPDCKKVYPADGWAEFEREKIIQEMIDYLKKVKEKKK